MFRRFMIAAVAALAIPASSQAVFTVTLDTATTAPTVFADNVAPDLQPLTGTIQLGSLSLPGALPDTPFLFGGYSIGIASTAWSTPLGTASLSSTTIIVVQKIDAAAGDLVITVTEDGFGSPPYDAMANGTYVLINDLTLVGTFTAAGTSPASTASVSSFTTASPALATTPTVTLTSVPGSGSSTTLFTKTASPFTMSQTITVTGLAAGEAAQFQATSTVAVPAPKSVLLALAGLPMIGLFGWLRARRKSIETVGSVA